MLDMTAKVEKVPARLDFPMDTIFHRAAIQQLLDKEDETQTEQI